MRLESPMVFPHLLRMDDYVVAFLMLFGVGCPFDRIKPTKPRNARISNSCNDNSVGASGRSGTMKTGRFAILFVLLLADGFVVKCLGISW
jgi:hypothetical protein